MLLRGFSSLSSGRAVQRNREGSPGWVVIVVLDVLDVLVVLEVDINVCVVEEITGKRFDVL
jgi:hypothetical protein